MLIDATHAEETRVVVVDGNKVEEFDFESENKRQLAGNIYLAKVTRVEPSLQAAFVDYGGNRHGFLAFSEIHPDYYQIPVADREALLAEEMEYARAQEEEEEKPKRSRRSRSRTRPKSKAEEVKSGDAVETREIDALEVIEPEASEADALIEEGTEVEEGTSPAFTVAETPVEEPEDDDAEADDAGEDEDEEDTAGRASDRDESIENVADDDTEEDIRRVRKPRPRRYKIQEVVKVRQIMLVQVVKEERGNKGAALTTYLSLAGRYCVLMPNTARGGGISRKITNAADRKKLKEIAGELEVPSGAGLIIRTAGSQRTKTEIKRDYDYLKRMWEQIRELTLKSVAPAKIYEEGDLIKRSIRDLYNKDIDEVFVEGEAGYREAKDFMKMIMPSHAKNVKPYTDPLPLFARYQVESYLAGMFNPTVQLKSGGYIVIDVTEALVAVDVNSGRATKEGSIEETALKTNLEAAEEVARQARLRDLAGLIVIDFIDMEERKNNNAVEKRLKDKLKTDRARIQVGRISGFGLLEMSRQRLRPGMLEATTQPCPHCHGTGLIRSDDNMALSILRQLEEEGTRKRSREVLLKAPVAIVNYLVNMKRENIAQIEARYGMAVRIEADPFLISPDFSLERFKTATRVVPEAAPVVSASADLMADYEEELEAEAELEEDQVEESAVASEEVNGEDDQKPKKRRRRRRRRGKSRDQIDGAETQGAEDEAGTEAEEQPEDERPAAEPAVAEEAAAADATAQAPAPEATGAEAAEKPKRTRTRSRRKTAEAESPEAEAAEAGAGTPAEAPAAEAAPKPKRSRAKKAEVATEEGETAEAKPKRVTRTRKTKAAEPATGEEAGEAPAEKPKRVTRKRKTKAEREAEAAALAAEAEAAAGTPETAVGAAADAAAPLGAPEAGISAGSEDVPHAGTGAEAAAEDGAEALPAAGEAPQEVPAAQAGEASEPAQERSAEEPAGEAAETAAKEPEMAEAEGAGDEAEDGKPKRRGWWNVAR
ncbi:RNAse E [Celeribacter indicus]|nr:RNAse E [Celeribacter indicus]